MYIFWVLALFVIGKRDLKLKRMEVVVDVVSIVFENYQIL